MLFASDFHRDLVGVDPEAHAHDGLDMSLFERGGALNAPNLCLPPYARASSYSPTFPVDIHARHGHGHSDSGLGLQVSQSDDDYSDRFPQSTLATDNFRDDFCMAANYPYLSNPCSDTHQFSSELYCISPASSETTDTTSSASCHAEMFSNTQSTPETARPHPNFTHTMPSFPRSNAQYGPQTHPTNGSQNFPRPVNHWGCAPSALPSISQNRRCSTSTPSSPATWHIGLGGTFGQFPVAEDVHRWPQLFKINQVKKVGVKKQQITQTRPAISVLVGRGLANIRLKVDAGNILAIGTTPRNF
ncbi:hypothetical protein MSAN_01955300 [Mycena sanguinolenta]|uniref:Uncharacterized protein n=1 Tax=Mycena sanguinolenta TaxID=230812 RepID=A0A8H6XNP9_9AGAR|nr:hypothetical protein MSAN_01955300 [Mycena sanguinolenta]